MSSDRQRLEKVAMLLNECSVELEQCVVPGSINEHVRMALRRLDDHLAMLKGWNAEDSEGQD